MKMPRIAVPVAAPMAALVALAGCQADAAPEGPVEPAVTVGAAQEAPAPPPIDRQAELRPTFTPFEVAPDVRNRDAVRAALQREYPPLLRDAGIGGTIILWFHIEADGRVAAVQLVDPSGHPQLDAAALRAAEAFEFTPALNRGEPVPVWVQIPITFQTSR